MGKQKQSREAARRRRHRRVRRKVAGTDQRPRLAVFRSARHIYGQLIDDDRGVTLYGIASSAPGVRERLAECEGGKIDVSRRVGKMFAERAVEGGLKRVVFDRGGYKFHGRVRAFAEGAREGGLEF